MTDHENAEARGQAGFGGEMQISLQSELSDSPQANVKQSIEYPPPSSVCGRVLGAHLLGEHLTDHDCRRKFGSTRLPHHEWVLKQKLGWPVQIVRRTRPTSDGTRTASIGEYFLPQTAIDEAGEQGQRYAAECARINAERRAA